MRKRLIALLGLLLALSLTASTAGANPLLAPTLPRTLAINLITDDGLPVPNAEIHLLTPGTTGITVARTDSAGQAKLSLPDGFSFWLRIWSAGNALIERAYVPATDGPTLTLTASAYTTTLSGIIRDDRGMPVTGATVKLYQTGLGLEATTVTDAMGSYRFGNARAGSNHVIQVEAKGYQPISQAVAALTADQLNQLDLDLTHAGGSVTGEVLDTRTLRPLGSVTVELILSGWGVVATTQSDTTGFFALQAPPSGDGTYQIRLSRPYFETTTSAQFSMPAGGWVDFSGANRFSVNRLYAKITGKVFDSANQPMSAVEVQLQRLDLGTVEVGKTDSRGTYTFENLAAGTYRVRAMPTGSQIRADGGWLNISGGQEVQSDITIDAVEAKTYGSERLTGKVENHLGDPVAKATVTISRGQDTYTAATDDRGSYDIEVPANVPLPRNADDNDPGTGYHVIVTAPGYLPNDQPVSTDGQPPSLISVQADADNRADFILRPQHATISGRVMNVYGQPVSGARVVLLQEGLSVKPETTTDSYGRYQFEKLPVGKQGRYAVAVEDSRHVNGAISPNGTIYDPAALDPANPLVLTLVAHPSTTLIQGIVQAGTERADSKAQVVVVDTSNGETFEGTVNESGYYQIRLPASPGAQYLVRVKSGKNAENTAQDPVNPGTNYGAQVNLTTHAASTITGQVLAADGQPLPGAEVFLYAEGAVGAQVTARTDSTGRYRFENLTPGRRYAVLAANGPLGLSGLAPGEAVITPLVALPSAEVIWADIQTSALPSVTPNP